MEDFKETLRILLRDIFEVLGGLMAIIVVVGSFFAAIGVAGWLGVPLFIIVWALVFRWLSEGQ